MPQGIFQPLTRKPSEIADRYANRLDDRTRDTSKESHFDVINRALIAGLLQGVGDEISAATSPAGIATAALPMLRSGRGILARSARTTPTPKVSSPPPNVVSSPEMVPVGGENIYNIIRMSEQTGKVKRVRDVAEKAEDAFRTQHGGVRPNLGNVDVVEMMQRVANARGR